MSFTAKKIGSSEESENAAHTEGDGEGRKLSREDIEEGPAQFGTITVCYLTLLTYLDTGILTAYHFIVHIFDFFRTSLNCVSGLLLLMEWYACSM